MGIIRGEGSQVALCYYTCYSSQVKSAGYLLRQIYTNLLREKLHDFPSRLKKTIGGKIYQGKGCLFQLIWVYITGVTC